MNTDNRTTIVILGAGKGGTALLELFTRLPGVEVVGIADQDASAPALHYAKRLNIPTTQDPFSLIRNPNIHLIVNVTGDPQIDHLVATQKSPETEALGGAASKVLWDLVQHESQMQAQLFQAEKLAGMGTFASGIAHDINNPLYILLAFAEHIQEETDLSIIHEQAASIIDAGKRIQKICQNLTQYSRTAKPRDAIPIMVSTTMDEALKIAQFATFLQDLTVIRNYEEHLHVLANPDELFQVFVNLMTNAIHAMEGKGTLSLSSWHGQNRGNIAITDTGCGIPEENLNKIFEPFFTTKAVGSGTGLGLYNVAGIIKKYGGHLSVESKVGAGTTFVIDLPLG
ncbi:MAG: ATP-binding protein [Nitrospirales bacterium]|nr:GHKL domain-containing protein [Nitrospira sp.]MDR4502129.1 ATP-binding protein [Nitrospirales bacterium]